MYPSVLLNSDVLDVLREVADSYFESVSPEFYCTFIQSHLKLKRGIESENPPKFNVPIIIREASEARQTDLLLGIVLKGDYIGVAPRTYEFNVGDTVIDSDRNSYSINAARLRSGKTYWVLDMTREIKDPSEL